MPRASVEQAIKEVVTESPDPSTQPVPAPTPEPDADIPDELRDRLNSARNRMKQAAKDHILGGISDALEEISAGNLGDVSHLIDAVDVFSERVSVPKLPTAIAKSPSSLFALPEGKSA